MAQIVPFPQHRVARIFVGKLPKEATPHEEALFRVRQFRAQRDSSTPEYRDYHMAQIMLDWWEGELARIVGARSHTARGAH